MSLVPASNSIFGELTIEEIFVYCEGPRLFKARSTSGREYIVLCVGESDDSDIYLYLEVSADRLCAVRSGQISLRETFRQPEAGLYRVDSIYNDEPRNEIMPVKPGEVPEDWLPAEGATLEVK
jgi:hypothetical protein